MLILYSNYRLRLRPNECVSLRARPVRAVLGSLCLLQLSCSSSLVALVFSVCGFELDSLLARAAAANNYISNMAQISFSVGA